MILATACEIRITYNVDFSIRLRLTRNENYRSNYLNGFNASEVLKSLPYEGTFIFA
jgi:hypothetical protein